MELTFARPKRRLLPATPAPGPPSSGSAEAGRSSCHGIASASECHGRFWRSESSVGRKLDRFIFHSGIFVIGYISTDNQNHNVVRRIFKTFELIVTKHVAINLAPTTFNPATFGLKNILSSSIQYCNSSSNNHDTFQITNLT